MIEKLKMLNNRFKFSSTDVFLAVIRRPFLGQSSKFTIRRNNGIVCKRIRENHLLQSILKRICLLNKLTKINRKNDRTHVKKNTIQK